MKPIHYLICLLLTTLAATAQDSTIALRRMPRAVVKFAPLSLLGSDATVQGGLEYLVAPLRSVQVELGYGGKRLNLFDHELAQNKTFAVWRLRSEVRFYSGRYRTNLKRGINIRSSYPTGNYLAPELLLKLFNLGEPQIEYTDRGFSKLGIPLSTSELVGRTITHRSVIAGHIKVGRQIAFATNSGKPFLLLDIYAGGGLRYGVTTVIYSVPVKNERCGCGYDRFADGRAVTPSITAGLKVGLAL